MELTPRSRRLALLAVLVVSATTNFQAMRGGRFLTEDSESYLRPARSLLAGRGFTTIEPPAYLLRQVPGFPLRVAPDTIRTPGYPAFLALCLGAGLSIAAIVAVQHLLNVALAGALFVYLDRRLGTRGVALGAALLFACFPPSIEAANQIMSETLCTLLVAGTCVSLERALRTRSHAFMAAAGMLAGTATLVRPITTYLFVPLLAVVLWRRRSIALTFLLAALVLPLAWMARNERVAGVAALSSTASENLLLEWAAGLRATEHDTAFERLTSTQQQSGFRSALHRAQLPLFLEAMTLARRDGVDPATASAALRGRYMAAHARSILRKEPLGVVELAASGAFELLIVQPALLPERAGVDPRTALLFFGPLAFAALVAAAFGTVALARKHADLALILGATIVYFVITSSCPEVDSRFLVPFAPMYLTTVAAGIGALKPYGR